MAESDIVRVLLIAGNNDHAFSLAEDLRRLAYHFVQVETGQQALARWLDGNFDAIILTTTLPDMDSVEVLKQIHANESGHSIPIVLFSCAKEIVLPRLETSESPQLQEARQR